MDDFKESVVLNREEKVISIVVHLIFALQSMLSISDAILEILLKICCILLNLLHNSLSIEKLGQLCQMFPSSLFTARKIIKLENNVFTKYVSCPSCCTIYNPDDAFKITASGLKESKLCSYVRFPNHTMSRFKEQCGTVLMKSFSSIDGKKTYLYPNRLYCYQPLKQSIQNLISRRDIFHKILQGPQKSTEGIMLDTIDGNFCKSFCDKNGDLYFDDPRNLGGILNIDWFQPFDNVQHSCGVVYMALLNLPREIRFKFENVIIIGIIPGPNEPKENVNSFLKPLIDDLLTFWDPGEMLDEDGSKALYKFALCCISSDLPATRKCCGFMSYNATRGMKQPSILILIFKRFYSKNKWRTVLMKVFKFFGSVLLLIFFKNNHSIL